MSSVALCPRCQGIIAVAQVDDPQRELRCPRCAQAFRVEEIMATATAEPPMAMPVDFVEDALPHPQETAIDTAAVETQIATASNNGVHDDESAGQSWTESLSAAEGATVISGDEDDPESRPYHEDPDYNKSLAVEGHNGSAWPELAASFAAETQPTSTAVEESTPEVSYDETQVEEAGEEASPAASQEPDAWGAANSVDAATIEGEPSAWGNLHAGEEASFDTAIAEEGGYSLSGAVAESIDAEPAAEFQAPTPVRRRRAEPSALQGLLMLVGVVLGGVVGLGAGYLILLWMGIKLF